VARNSARGGRVDARAKWEIYVGGPFGRATFRKRSESARQPGATPTWWITLLNGSGFSQYYRENRDGARAHVRLGVPTRDRNRIIAPRLSPWCTTSDCMALSDARQGRGLSSFYVDPWQNGEAPITLASSGTSLAAWYDSSPSGSMGPGPGTMTLARSSLGPDLPIGEGRALRDRLARRLAVSRPAGGWTPLTPHLACDLPRHRGGPLGARRPPWTNRGGDLPTCHATATTWSPGLEIGQRRETLSAAMTVNVGADMGTFSLDVPGQEKAL